MAQKTCKNLTALVLAIPLFWGLANSSNAQTYATQPQSCNSQGCGIGIMGPRGGAIGIGSLNTQGWRASPSPSCINGRCNPSQGNTRPAPPAARPVAPPQRQEPSAGILHKAIVETRSSTGDMQKHGYATAVKFEGKFYLVSCAHVWGGMGWKHSIIFEGRHIAVEMLGVAQLDDLAILKCPPGLYYMLLSPKNAAVGTRVNLSYRAGTVKGYRASDVVVRGYVKNGDSGGPIFNASGLVGIIASYEYPEGSNPNQGDTSGPCATRISTFIRSLTESPSLPAPVSSEVLDRISKLEELIRNLPQDGNCKDLVIKVKSLTETVDRNKLEIDKNRQRIDDLDQRVKDNALGIQRTAGVVEIVQKEVIAQNKRIGELDQKSKDTVLRIQRLETSVTSFTKSETTSGPQKGQLRFRLRLDQSGRVLGIEPR